MVLINSSNCFRIKVLCQVPHRKQMGKILVAGKRLNLGVRGPGEKPSWGETRSSSSGGSDPGQESWSVSRGEAHTPQSLGTKGKQEGWPSCRVEYRIGGTDLYGRGVHQTNQLCGKAQFAYHAQSSLDCSTTQDVTKHHHLSPRGKSQISR